MLYFRWSRENCLKVSARDLDSFRAIFTTVVDMSQKLGTLPEVYKLQDGCRVVFSSRKKITPETLERFQGNDDLYFTQFHCN